MTTKLWYRDSMHKTYHLKSKEWIFDSKAACGVILMASFEATESMINRFPKYGKSSRKLCSNCLKTNIGKEK